MIVGIASHKGGVGKTTTAIHIAAILQGRGSTLLVDGDVNRSALAWAERSHTLPFKVVDETQAENHLADHEHIVIDTAAHPSKEYLQIMVESADQIIVITEPETMSLDVLPTMLSDLQALGSQTHKILLTQVPPLSQAIDARGLIEMMNVPIFKAHIRSYAAFKRAALEGTTVDKVNDPHAPHGWKDYRAVAKELL